jgi:hypothetical protein
MECFDQMESYQQPVSRRGWVPSAVPRVWIETRDACGLHVPATRSRTFQALYQKSANDRGIGGQPVDGASITGRSMGLLPDGLSVQSMLDFVVLQLRTSDGSAE